MNKLVIAVFKLLVAVDVLHVESAVELKPFLVAAFVLDPHLLVLPEGLQLHLHSFQELVDGLSPLYLVKSV